MKTEQLNKWLISHNACRPARDWLHASRAASAAEAWDKCERGDWLLWCAATAGVDRKKLVLAACATARLVLHLVPAGEDRPRIAIETAEAWTRGEATLAEVRAAAARTNMQAQCADVVRSLITWADIAAACPDMESM